MCNNFFFLKNFFLIWEEYGYKKQKKQNTKNVLPNLKQQKVEKDKNKNLTNRQSKKENSTTNGQKRFHFFQFVIFLDYFLNFYQKKNP